VFSRGSLTAAAALGVAAAASSWLAATSLAGRSATTTIVQGTVVDAVGAPVVGATALLYYPLPVSSSGTARSILVASGLTDGKGAFSLTAENTPLLTKLAAPNDGWLNLDLLVANTRLYLYRSVPRRFEPTAGWRGTDDVDGSVDLGPLPLAPGKPGVGKTSGKEKPHPRSVQSSERALTCTDTTTSSTSVKLVTTVGELHNVNANAQFTYGPTAGSTIDAAMVPGSAGGVWMRSGTSAVGTTRASAVTRSVSTSYGASVRTYFSYQRRLILNTCTGYRRTIKAVSWQGGLAAGKINDPSSHCTVAPYNAAPRKVAYPPPSPFTRNSGLALKFDPAANITTLTTPQTLTVGARSGFSSHAWSRWSFSPTGALCGDTGAPSVSTRIFAGT
jgi:hypothetical protein